MASQSSPVLGLIEMLIVITLLRAPRFLSLIQGLFLLLLMDWVSEILIKIFLPRVSLLLRLSWIQGLVRLVMLIKTFLPRVPWSLSLKQIQGLLLFRPVSALLMIALN